MQSFGYSCQFGTSCFEGVVHCRSNRYRSTKLTGVSDHMMDEMLKYRIIRNASVVDEFAFCIVEMKPNLLAPLFDQLDVFRHQILGSASIHVIHISRHQWTAE
jgi:hypothetical protein